MKARPSHNAEGQPLDRNEAPSATDARVFVGRVEEFSGGIVWGWAWTPRRPGYRCVIHVVDESRILRVGLVSLPGDARETLVGPSHRFEFDLSALENARLARLRFVIGEGQQELRVSHAAQMAMAVRREMKEFITVEDLLAVRSLHPWARGATYYDAIDAGLRPSEIVDLFYLDYLGREADPEGLEHYCTRIESGASTYDDLRVDLLRSPEFEKRLRGPGELVGAIFSEELVYAPGRRLPWDHVPPRVKTVASRAFWPTWGRTFIEQAYQRICRGPLTEELRAATGEMLNGACTKFDVVERFYNIANEFSRIVTIEDMDSLKLLPARRYHEIPLHLLLECVDDREFITTAYELILGEELTSEAVEELLLNLDWSSRTDTTMDLVQKAHQNGVPVVVTYDQVLARKLFEGKRRDAFELLMGDNVVGYGWHEVERAGGEAFRWMGDAAGVIVPALAQDERFTIRVEGFSYLHRRALESLHCSINGVQLNGRAESEESGRWSFTSELVDTREIDVCYPYIIEFSVAGKSIPQHPRDRRFLSLAFAGITIRKVEFEEEWEKTRSSNDVLPRDRDGYALPLPCLVPADVLDVPSAFDFGGESRLRHSSKIVFRPQDHDKDLDERCLFFGPYISLSPGGYSVKSQRNR